MSCVEEIIDGHLRKLLATRGMSSDREVALFLAEAAWLGLDVEAYGAEEVVLALTRYGMVRTLLLRLQAHDKGPCDLHRCIVRRGIVNGIAGCRRLGILDDGPAEVPTANDMAILGRCAWSSDRPGKARQG